MHLFAEEAGVAVACHTGCTADADSPFLSPSPTLAGHTVSTVCPEPVVLAGPALPLSASASPV